MRLKPGLLKPKESGNKVATAVVVKLVDTQRSGRCCVRAVWVQVPPTAQS